MFILYFCICLLLAEGTLASFSLNKRQGTIKKKEEKCYFGTSLTFYHSYCFKVLW